uniref:Cationic amino acid transporter C-terminal domain-containing protein n=1 Tax=Catagonus wagneri TaxID=51154 RepID=A0A8C3WYU2_9CETA
YLWVPPLPVLGRSRWEILMVLCLVFLADHSLLDMSGMLSQYVRLFGEKLVRRKSLEPREGSESQMPHLNFFDLVMLGLGRMLRSGVYFLAGSMAKFIAGPAIIISYLVATLFALLSGLCYAEFGAWVPYSGSTYLYTYVTMGQLYAFLFGWNSILSSVLGIAILSRAWSYFFDSLTGNYISQVLQKTFSLYMPPFLASYPDFVAMALVLLKIGLLVLGVYLSVLVSRVFTGINLFVKIFIMIFGFINGDLHNWQLTEEDYNLASSRSNHTYRLGPLGSGGFVPFGFDGILQGAAFSFYAFFEFDVIATKGQEALNPHRSIPLGIVIALSICFLAYSGVSAALTLMVPYYQIHPENPLQQAFFQVGWDAAGYVVVVGTLCALTSRLHSAVFRMHLVMCEMADDGLIFRGLARVHGRTEIPILAVLWFLTGISDLVDLMSTGTLLSYTLVVFSVLVLRYQPDQNFRKEKSHEETEIDAIFEARPLESVPEAGTSNILKSLCDPISTTPTPKSGQIVYGCAFLLVLLLTILSLILAQWPSRVFSGDPGFTTGAVLLLLLITGVTVIIWRQPQNPSPLHFKVPALPVLPVLTIFLNLYLMMQMTSVTWAQFGIWNAVGKAIGHLEVGKNRDQQPPASNSQALDEHTSRAGSS